MSVNPRSIPPGLGRGGGDVHRLREFLDNTAERPYAVLRVAANVADGERVSIGTDTFEIDIINTSTGQTVAAAGIANVTTPTLVDIPAHGLIVGDLIRIDNEIMRVRSVYSTSRVQVFRAVSGTTAASHAAGATIYKSDTPNIIVQAGRIPIGLVTTFTPAVFLAALAAAINADIGKSGQSASTRAIVIGTNTMLLVADKKVPQTMALSETLAGAGNAWDAATFTGGVKSTAGRILSGARVPSAAEVTAGQLFIPLDFTPRVMIIQVRTNTGVVRLWDGVATITPAAGGNPAYVTIDNSGVTDWVATDTIYYMFAE